MATEASFRERVEFGRQAVSDYRAAHAQLHTQGYYPQIHDDHTPLLEELKGEFKEQDFNTLDEFFDASELLNLNDLGFKDRVDFEARATEADREALKAKWQ